MKKGFFLFITSMVVALPQAQAENFEIHVLKEGETLSELLHSKGYHPLYGEDQWVDKTLKMNHLASPQAKEIKKGFPIILPRKTPLEPKTIYKEKVVFKTKPRKKLGMFSNFISEHQDAYLNFNHSQKETNLPGAKVFQRENFLLGLEVEGKNRHRMGRLFYDINGKFEVESQGSGQFNTSERRNVNFQPTYELGADIAASAPGVPFKFGPSISLEEKSRVQQITSDDFETRRDQIFWLGFNIKNDLVVFDSPIKNQLGYRQKLVQSIVEGEGEFSISEVFGSTRVQLTDNYLMGLNARYTNFNSISINDAQSLGVSFSYLIK